MAKHEYNEVAFTNINTLKEMGITIVTPVLSASAEKTYFGVIQFHRNIVDCQKYSDCLDCPQFCPCNGIQIDTIHQSSDRYVPNKDVE